MAELRLILLGVGVLVVAGVYLYSRYGLRGGSSESTGSEKQEHRGGAAHESSGHGTGNGSGSGYARREPGMHEATGQPDDEDLPSLRVDGGPDTQAAEAFTAAGEENTRNGSADQRPSADKPVSGKEKLIVLNILPMERDGRFRGNDLLEVFDRAGLEYGRFDVFHRMVETPDGIASVFSVASATEPGSFEISEMADESFKGLTMFMLLPGPQGGVAAFADMLATARRMAQQLNADVTDRNRSSMTRQTAHHIREDIIAFEHQFQKNRSE